MSVYLYTFRTAHKTAVFNGSPVTVYAFRFLCKAQDIDGWDRGNRAKLLQANAAKASDRFDAIKPRYIALVHENEWDGVTVYKDFPGGCWYDSDVKGGQPVGFLRLMPRGWEISTERHCEETPMFCGLTFTRRYVERAENGQLTRTVKSYRCHSNGVELTPEAFEVWRAKEEPLYVAACMKRREEQQQAERERQAAWELQQRRDKANKAVEEARATLTRLEQERAQIGA